MLGFMISYCNASGKGRKGKQPSSLVTGEVYRRSPRAHMPLVNDSRDPFDDGVCKSIDTKGTCLRNEHCFAIHPVDAVGSRHVSAAQFARSVHCQTTLMSAQREAKPTKNKDSHDPLDVMIIKCPNLPASLPICVSPSPRSNLFATRCARTIGSLEFR